jgi:hypothetical protein
VLLNKRVALSFTSMRPRLTTRHSSSHAFPFFDLATRVHQPLYAVPQAIWHSFQSFLTEDEKLSDQIADGGTSDKEEDGEHNPEDDEEQKLK